MPFPITLDSGRDDMRTVYFSPEKEENIKEYNIIVDAVIDSKTYNKFVIDDYLQRNILTVIEFPVIIQDPVVPPPTSITYSGWNYSLTRSEWNNGGGG